MRVLFISRATLFSTRGGDTIQMEKTAAALKSWDIDVEIATANQKDIDYSSFELIHFFNLIRPADILYHIRKSKLPYVVSPIYVKYDQMGKKNNAFSVQGFLSLFPASFQEYAKCIARSLLNQEKIVSPEYLFMGHRRSIQYILDRCKLILPNSQSEALRLQSEFQYTGGVCIIPNAVDTEIFYPQPEIHPNPKAILCVARFEPRKNQLNVIKALSHTEFTLTLVGDVAPNHQAYYQQCRKIAGDNVRFVDFVAHEKLAALYRTHKVHVLVSWFETTGLSSLEAAACGCNIVVSQYGDTRDYFEGYAWFGDPDDPDHILQTIKEAASSEKNFAPYFLKNYNWHKAAQQTAEAYKMAIKIK